MSFNFKWLLIQIDMIIFNMIWVSLSFHDKIFLLILLTPWSHELLATCHTKSSIIISHSPHSHDDSWSHLNERTNDKVTRRRKRWISTEIEEVTPWCVLWGHNVNDVDRVVLWFSLTGEPVFGNSAALPISASRRLPKTTNRHGEWAAWPWQKEV